MLDIHVNSPLVPPVEDCDLTLLGAREDFDANIVARPIASSAGILCVSPDYLERYGTPQQPEALAQHRCLRLKQPSSRHRSWQLINPEHDKRKVDIAVEPAILANHSETLLHASVMEAGISAQSINIDSDILTSLINSEAFEMRLVTLDQWSAHALRGATRSKVHAPANQCVAGIHDRLHPTHDSSNGKEVAVATQPVGNR